MYSGDFETTHGRACLTAAFGLIRSFYMDTMTPNPAVMMCSPSYYGIKTLHITLCRGIVNIESR